MKEKIIKLADDALSEEKITLSTYYDIIDYLNFTEKKISQLTKENKELKKNNE